MHESGPKPRLVDLEILLQGEHRQRLSLPENSPLLTELFETLANEPGESRFFQIPVREGKGAFSFHSSQLVAVLTRPPVVLEIEPRPAVPGVAGQQLPGEVTAQQPRWAVVEDFLSPLEYQSLLDWALQRQELSEPGTVGGRRHQNRENLVTFDFGYSAHANLIRSRLLTWFPLLCRQLEMPVFALQAVESRLTAANDGQYHRIHDDVGGEGVTARELTCVYFFHRQPNAFEGGELRLYDAEVGPDGWQPAATFRTLEPAANRMIAFPTNVFHEVRAVRCLSREFDDSQFAVTSWLRRSDRPDPDARFGWGQLRCGVVPQDFV